MAGRIAPIITAMVRLWAEPGQALLVKSLFVGTEPPESPILVTVERPLGPEQVTRLRGVEQSHNRSSPGGDP
jgi:hypothetical protein